ncbi:MAG: dehydratase [Anaerolineae bacterium]|nr:dehydratase [Anaerolineae bacterium]MBT7070969.1 dehydratase [Anaerolineae bacterium]MBT7325875.1 dehydratase [Anaerolineae bacterium]
MPAARGMYFEEFEVGQKMFSPGRTITETDVVGFAGLSGDYNLIHTDAEYSKNSPFGARVAHGLLGLSIASGLALRTGVLEGTVMAFREINSWKFVKPIFIGDTIRVEMEIVETKAMKRLGGGKVELLFNVLNQSDETTMKGVWSVLVMGKPE